MLHQQQKACMFVFVFCWSHVLSVLGPPFFLGNSTVSARSSAAYIHRFIHVFVFMLLTVPRLRREEEVVCKPATNCPLHTPRSAYFVTSVLTVFMLRVFFCLLVFGQNRRRRTEPNLRRGPRHTQGRTFLLIASSPSSHIAHTTQNKTEEEKIQQKTHSPTQIPQQPPSSHTKHKTDNRRRNS